MYSGKIDATGPRYCPSVEDKVVRFSDNPSHQLFLEPEWNNSKQIYINGFSTSMPEDVQIKALRTIVGLENCEIIIKSENETGLFSYKSSNDSELSLKPNLIPS